MGKTCVHDGKVILFLMDKKGKRSMYKDNLMPLGRCKKDCIILKKI